MTPEQTALAVAATVISAGILFLPVVRLRWVNGGWDDE